MLLKQYLTVKSSLKFPQDSEHSLGLCREGIVDRTPMTPALTGLRTMRQACSNPPSQIGLRAAVGTSV